MKSSIFKTILAAMIFCAAILAPAQTTFTSLFSFAGSNGANPRAVNLVQGPDGYLYGTTQVSIGTNGTVFKITTAGALTTLHTFCTSGYPCADGATPYPGVMLASNGNFYGTTFGEGANGDGTVYQITNAGTFSTLHAFDGTDGTEPEVGLIQATNGDLYGTTTEGGTSGEGTIYQITTTGTLSSLLSFNGTNGIYPDARLVQGTNGDFYGTTLEGDANSGTIFKITAAGELTTLHKFDGTDGAGPTGALIQASNGNLYGTTQNDGANGGGTVFQITPTGTFKTLYSFCAKTDCADGSSPYAGLIQATDGNLYGTTFGGGANETSCNGGCGTLFKITTKGVLTTLYSFCAEANCADGSQPWGGLTQDTNGTLYGTTYYSGNNNDDAGTVFSLSVGLAPFVETVPASGEVGVTVMILGTNLTGATKVTFDGIAATFTVVSSTEITATVPTGAKKGTVEVTTPSGTLKSNVTFTVTT